MQLAVNVADNPHCLQQLDTDPVFRFPVIKNSQYGKNLLPQKQGISVIIITVFQKSDFLKLPQNFKIFVFKRTRNRQGFNRQ